MVRNDPTLPTQALLRALVRIKQSGEVERIVQRYTSQDAAGQIVSGSSH
jgi:polar amino acid transport system substrate-binding protein